VVFAIECSGTTDVVVPLKFDCVDFIWSRYTSKVVVESTPMSDSIQSTMPALRPTIRI
jgi:hypothetical protein